jgi:transposase
MSGFPLDSSAIFKNYERKSLIMPDRKKQTIAHFLAHLEHKERVQVCVIDMWRPYLEALQETLPHVTVVIDKFHVLKMLSEVVETVRKEIRAQLSDRQRRELMHDRFLLLKRPRDLSERDRLILEAWLGSFPRLKAVYERKEEFYDIYEARSEEQALKLYFTWFDHVVSSGDESQLDRPIPKISEPACYGRKIERRSRTYLSWPEESERRNTHHQRKRKQNRRRSLSRSGGMEQALP